MQTKPNLIWLDVETTGLDYKVNSIIELFYMVDVDGKLITAKHLASPVEDISLFDKKALDTNLFFPNQIQSFPDPETVVQKIISELEPFVLYDKLIIAGYNVALFDYLFLKEMFFRAGRVNDFNRIFSYHTLDVSTLVTALRYEGFIDVDSQSLFSMACYFDILFSPHIAEEDCRTTRELYFKLFGLLKSSAEEAIISQNNNKSTLLSAD